MRFRIKITTKNKNPIFFFLNKSPENKCEQRVRFSPQTYIVSQPRQRLSTPLSLKQRVIIIAYLIIL